MKTIYEWTGLAEIARRSGMKEKGDSFMREYRIPRRGQKVAILRIEHPIDEHDMNQLRKFLDFLEITVEIHDPRQEEATKDE